MPGSPAQILLQPRVFRVSDAPVDMNGHRTAVRDPVPRGLRRPVERRVAEQDDAQRPRQVAMHDAFPSRHAQLPFDMRPRISS